MAKQRTRTDTIYQWNELSDDAKDNARNRYFACEYNWGDEALDSLKALAKHFATRLADYSIYWDDCSHSYAKFTDCELSLSKALKLLGELGEYNPDTFRGLGECKLTGVCFDEPAIDGARKYLLSDPEPQRLWLNEYTCPDCGEHWENEYDCQVDDECPECGCRHITPESSELIEETINAADILNAAFDTWLECVQADYRYQISDESIAENCEANDYWFDESGELV